jgi:hypothetical protein
MTPEAIATSPAKPRAHAGWIVTRNGRPCVTLHLDVPRFPRTRNVCLPAPLPPRPRVFPRWEWAFAAMERTRKVSSRLQESIHAAWLAGRFPHLAPLFKHANYAVVFLREEDAS